MLNKRIKSLLITGLVILGMSGSVFAEGNGNDGCQVPGLRGHVSSNEHKVEDVTQDTFLAWVAEVNSTNTGIVIESPNNFNGNGYHTFKVYKDADFNHEKDDNHQIEVLHVKFSVQIPEEEKSDDPQPPTPVNPPELPVEPPTGDASIMPIVVTALASAAGLYVVCKKDDEE